MTSQPESPPKTNPSNPGCVPAPGPGLELVRARLVVESGTSDPASPYPELLALPGGVGGSLAVGLGEAVRGGSAKHRGLSKG